MKLFFNFFLITLFYITTPNIFVKAENPKPEKSPVAVNITTQTNYSNATETEKQINSLLSFAHKFRGVPYRYGGTSPRGFDCSGFTSYVFKRFGIELDRSSRGQISDGVRVKKNDLQPGDLVFFQGRSGRGGVGHVGIVTKVNEDNTFHFIHSACSSGVTESKNTESYYSRRYVGACRVL
jgi:cell wall-associated NlpC family hydrolase